MLFFLFKLPPSELPKDKNEDKEDDERRLFKLLEINSLSSIVGNDLPEEEVRVRLRISRFCCLRIDNIFRTARNLKHIKKLIMI
jgi:hypothetical protein